MAPESKTSAPSTPTRHGSSRPNAIFDAKISLLCSSWPLGLEPKQDHSPSKSERTIQDECLFLMKWCHHKHVLDQALTIFKSRADILYCGWVKKPKADRGVLPRSTRHVPRPVNEHERAELLECLVGVLKAQREAHPNYKSSMSPQTLRTIDDGFLTKAIAFPLSPRMGIESKRAREESFPDIAPTKKSKARVGSMLNPMAPPPDRGRPNLSRMYSSISANISFTSDSSSIFSRPSFDPSTMASTQDTVLDDNELPPHKTEEDGPAFTTIQEARNKSSDYGASSSFERAALNTSFEGEIGNDNELEIPINNDLSQDLRQFEINAKSSSFLSEEIYVAKECAVLAGLETIFPSLPPCLRSASVHIVYEITRVFLYAEVPLSEFKGEVLPLRDDYDLFWNFLESMPSLKGRQLPARCEKAVWAAASESSRQGSYAVVFGGTLHFNYDGSKPLFRLRLEPMKLDLSHRLGRRYGNDRFLEICIPSLPGDKLPQSLIDLDDPEYRIVYNWLVDTQHSLLGRCWQPFFTKPKERRSRKSEAVKESTDAELTTRVYFFAVAGYELQTITIENLLNSTRPTRMNNQQSYLKLFSRTALAVSRNSETLVLTKSQIIFCKHDLVWPPPHEPGSRAAMSIANCPKPEVMNDGAGLMSPTMALKITEKLGLSYTPTAFQGRLGEAKGLWIVDHADRNGEDWLKVYPSQQKWTRSTEPGGESDDPSHRTFEVLKFSSPLRSAELNMQFLPLLVDRAKNRQDMRIALENLLKVGLNQEVKTIGEAVEDPQLFKQWVRQSNPNTKERLKHGGVQFRAGLPTSIEEQLNLMLDAGFRPTSLLFMLEAAKKLFRHYANNLKERLSIRVGKSTYAYMVPDFWGVLAADEVYMDFSSFVDGVSGHSVATFNGIDVLVARSPAHFASDIQKVTAVIKAELVGLKDVIVFPTRGNPSLAAKLSGGDYDGDIAWVCWEKSIVDNFITADVTEPLDLIGEGLLGRVSTTYKELVGISSDPTSVFLKEAFRFNMKPTMLGKCTNWKERVAYASGHVDSIELRYLNQLLSDLVDAPKQGFVFDEEAWSRFKKAKVSTRPFKENKWKPGEPKHRANHHINDYLKCVAEGTVEKALENIHERLGSPPSYDEDLSAYYKWARNQGLEWKALLDELEQELKKLKEKWNRHFSRSSKDDELRPEFVEFSVRCHDEFKKICPHVVDTPLAQSLLSDFCRNEEQSPWSLLKASTLFASYNPRQKIPSFPWWIAGRQLLRLKAMRSLEESPFSIIPSMYIINKPDSSMIRRLRSVGDAGLMDDNASVANVEDLEAMDDD